MNTYLQPEDDGLPIREFGSWVAEKLDYLKRYIDIFVTAMHGKPWRRMHYIDLFAGSGKCRAGKRVYLGSPLLALTARYPFTDYFFVDINKENVVTLQQRCMASPWHKHVRVLQGDGNKVVHKIVDHILAVDSEYLEGQWPSLNLAFLDPDGLELEWSTVETLARVNRMDLIIHYPQGGLNRSMKQAFRSEEETRVDRFFGDREWRKIYQKWRAHRGGLHRELMDYYKSRLQRLGYKETRRDDEVGDEPLIRNAKRNAPLYRLLFASKHPLGEKFWKEVVRRDVHGQRRMF